MSAMFSRTPTPVAAAPTHGAIMKRSENQMEIENITPARTLEELGVPGPLAKEMEGALRVLGGASRWNVFVTPDGVAHPLRAEAQPEERRRVANG
jgi:hypothetical protein